MESGPLSGKFVIGIAVVFVVSIGSNLAKAEELCVGAKGHQKVGYCKYEYEAYVTTGSCTARNGQYDSRFDVTLFIYEPQHQAGQLPWRNNYVNGGGDYAVFCSNACATGSARGPRQYSKSVCDRRSFE